MEKITHQIKGMKTAGPYSHAVEVAGWIFVSGVGPVNFEMGKVIADDIKSATSQVMENIKVILDSVGSSLENVVKVTIFLKDMAVFQSMNEVYATYFTSNPPARTCVAVREMPFDIPIEIEVIAIK